MQKKTYIGIDNGVTGTIGILSKGEAHFFETPSYSEQSYTQKKGNISRIDFVKLKKLLEPFKNEAIAFLERPMVNPKMFFASISAVRALETTLLIIEQLGIAYRYIDSKEWQRKLLPKGIKGSANLKKASEEIGCRYYPQFAKEIKKHKDADGLLIARYCMLVENPL